MVSMLASSAVYRGFEPLLGQTKDYKIGISCFSTKNTALRRKSKDWLIRNQDNVSEWGDMSIADCCFSDIPVNSPPFRRSLPRKSLISRMDWVSCAGDINLPHTPFPPARSPPNKKIKYNKILTYILRSIFLEIPHLDLPR
jgi:hypothetical protein